MGRHGGEAAEGGGTQFRYDDNKDKLSGVDMKRKFCRRDLCCQGKNENESTTVQRLDQNLSREHAYEELQIAAGLSQPNYRVYFPPVDVNARLDEAGGSGW